MCVYLYIFLYNSVPDGQAIKLIKLNLCENFLNANRTQSSREKSKSQRSAENHGFSPGTPVSTAQGKLTGWVR